MTNYTAEAFGTAMLILLGDGVVANVLLARSKGEGSGWIVITFGWGVAVMVAVYAVGRLSGAHLNPAVTVALASIGAFQWSDVPGYIAAQMVGAVVGAVLVWLMYLPHWPVTQDANLKLAVFCTGPAIRKPAANLVAETIATAAFVFAILAIAPTHRRLPSPETSICPWSSAAGCSRCWSEVWCWVSDCRSAARPVMPSTRQEIWGPASRTSCCRFPASGIQTGATRGFRSSARSSVA